MGSSSVLNNISSLVAQHSLQSSGLGLEKTLFRVSTGLRIRAGGDDPAGLAIADGLKAQIRTLSQSVRNGNDGIGFVQTADGALSEVNNLLSRAAQLLTQAATDTNSAQEAAIETELAEIYQEIDRIGAGTTFNSTAVFSATAQNIFVGDTGNATTSNATISFTTSALSIANLGISGGVTGSGSTVAVDITAVASETATAMLAEVDAAIDNVAQRRGATGCQHQPNGECGGHHAEPDPESAGCRIPDPRCQYGRRSGQPGEVPNPEPDRYRSSGPGQFGGAGSPGSLLRAQETNVVSEAGVFPLRLRPQRRSKWRTVLSGWNTEATILPKLPCRTSHPSSRCHQRHSQKGAWESPARNSLRHLPHPATTLPLTQSVFKWMSKPGKSLSVWSIQIAVRWFERFPRKHCAD